MSVATFLSLLGWVVTGAIAGYLASVMLRTEREGCFLNIALGVAGAFVGGFVVSNFLPNLFNLFGSGPVAGFFNTILHAIIGAVILLIIAELVLPGRQLGVRGERKSRRRRRR